MLQEFIGETVTMTRPVCDYWQFGLGNAVISILAPFAVTRNSETISLNNIYLQTLERIEETPELLTLFLSDGARVDIDLREEVATGPEALNVSQDFLFFPRPEGSS